MARFSDIQKGKRARRAVVFPMPHTRCSLLPPLAELEAQWAADRAGNIKAGDAAEPGSVAPVASAEQTLVALVVLTGEEEAQALELARAAAVKAGVAEPKPNEPIYDLAVMVYTLLVGCVDHESPIDAPRPFFESAEQIRRNLSRDQIAHLYASHEHWQDECSPEAKDLDERGFYTWLVGVADSEDPSDFFAKLRPGMLWRSVRTTARLLLASPAGRLAPGGTSETDTSPSTSPAEATHSAATSSARVAP